MLHEFTAENLWVISDFDRTFTRWWGETAFGVFESCPSIPDELKQAQLDNYMKYRKIEVDLLMNPDERNQHMRDWFHAGMDALGKYLTQERFEDAVSYGQKNIHLREWMRDFALRMNELDVPFILNSAGISDIIRWVLEHNWVPYTGVHWNSFRFDEQGKFSGLNNLPVHIDDKNWEALPQDLVEIFSQKTHFLVLWDAVWDIKMGPSDRSTFNVWFLVWEQKRDEQRFRDVFDHVIESDDCDRWFLAEISSWLSGK